MLLFLIAFVAGAAYECGCVFWVHYSEKNQAGLAAAWSCFNALVTVLGVETFLRGWMMVIAYVAGFGVGTYLAVRYKRVLIEQLEELETVVRLAARRARR